VSSGGSTAVLIVALGCNLAIAVATFAVYAVTGSSVMLSEATHALCNASSQSLLWHGVRRSESAVESGATKSGPKELYFWSYIAAIQLFSLGAGVALYGGVGKLMQPQPIDYVHFAYAAIAMGLAMQGVVAWRVHGELTAEHGETVTLQAVRTANDPALFTMSLQTLAALACLVIAFVGVFASTKLGILEADGAASILIGFVLAGVAAFMSLELRSLLTGVTTARDSQRSRRSETAHLNTNPTERPAPAWYERGNARFRADYSNAADISPKDENDPNAQPQSKVT
jgi:divalent metal cation (Fe/Co/Zn/Cd) transporter